MLSMRIRFTEFFRKDQQEISLYVIQETNGRDYTVHVQNGERKQIVFFEKMGNRWNMFANHLPEWVRALEPTIVRTIEYRIIVGIEMATSGNLRLDCIKNKVALLGSASRS